MNLLLVTLDQFRGDCLSAAGHGVVRTPNLDHLATSGVRFDRHYSQSAPCSPGRACLYTGTYQMNNRVVANGTPLDNRFDNVARAGRRGGFDPTLFGYTDQGADPRLLEAPDDPRLSSYEGVLPGFTVGLDLTGEQALWVEWLRDLGYDVPSGGYAALETEPDRPEDVGLSAFMTNRFLDWLERRDGPWFAHLSFLRPHPPYAAAGRWAYAFAPDDVDLPIAPAPHRHPFHDAALLFPQAAAPVEEGDLRRLRSQYYGMIGDVDAQLGRVWDALGQLGQWEDTFVLVTSDHGEQLGDHGLIQKLGYFEESYRVLGIVRSPSHPGAHGTVVNAFTENVDFFPTICEALGLGVPPQCDGLPLTAFIEGGQPPWWRSAAAWEFDWRYLRLPGGAFDWPWDRRLERDNLAVRRFEDGAYVHFGDGSWRCFDLDADPTWRTEVDDANRILGYAQSMLTWRAEHADRNVTSFLLESGGVGRWPTESVLAPS
ncbi:MAG TPA: sulfatase-like hydrolase/transferase [Acidimicrobiales bacterium]|nr:sulfatase-like hydrolase/transferase [Acidimicrobiales bacterium]